MNKRDYAISLGLAKPGRGRLSREAHAAIDKAISEGMVFSDVKPAAAPATAPEREHIVDTPKPKPQTAKRNIKTYTLTTTMGQVIRFGHCARCKQAIMYCGCYNGPRYPEWIASEVETWQPDDLVVG